MFAFFHHKKFPRYATIEKQVGETPLVALERVRITLNIPKDVPMAYAGRLDPMASGKLLILIGDECKVQEKYHTFDKEYQVEILLGVTSDSGDVLGILSPPLEKLFLITEADTRAVLESCVGAISLPYPHFSSKTVHGKPLHTWTLENRLNEITIPTKTSTVLKLVFNGLRTIPKSEILEIVRKKIETIPEVTDLKKALGADFRRTTVRASWNEFSKNDSTTYYLLTFLCVASSGTYMRSLASHIAEKLGTCGLAYSIHRTKIGRYVPITRAHGFWVRKF